MMPAAGDDLRPVVPGPGKPRNRPNLVRQAGLAACVVLAWLALADGELLAGPTGGALPFRNYGVRDGLVQDQAFSIYQDGAGYIWIGTMGGLSRYDGTSFRNFSLKDGLPSATISTIFQDSTRRLWVGTYNGAAYLAGDRFVPAPFKSLKHRPAVYSICEAADGTLYFGTSAGLVRLRGGAEKIYTKKDGLLDNAVLALLRTPDDLLFIGTFAGLNGLDRGKLVAYPEVNRDAKDEVRSLFLLEATGELLITRRNRLTLRHPSGRCQDILPDPAGKALLWDSLVDRQGTVWATSGSGLYCRFPNEEFRCLTVEADLASDWLYELMVDYEDNLWVCTNQGLSKLSDRTVSLYDTRVGLSDNRVWTVFPVGDDVLLGTEKGFQLLGRDGLRPEVYLPDCDVVQVARLKDDAYLLGTDQGLYEYRGGRATPVGRDKSLREAFVYGLVVLADGSVMAATDRGLFHGRLPDVTEVKIPARLINGPIFDLVQVRPDAWWLATERGIVTVTRQADGWTPGEQIQLENTEIETFTRGPDGQIYIGTLGSGIFNWDGRTISRFSADLPTQSDNIWAMRFDPAGTLWVGTSRGVAFLEDGRFHNFNAIHGLRGDEITNKQSIYADGRGDVYFGTTAGLIHYHPRGAPVNPPPRVAITGVEVNQQPLGDWSGKLRLSHDDRLKVSFKCLSFINEDGNQYQFRLDGVDESWQGPTRDSHVLYPFLPPGRTTFRLRGINSRGVASAEEPVLRLEVRPPFTQTGWFYLLLGLGAALLTGCFVGYKVHLDRIEKTRLRSMVEEKTAALQASEENYRQLVDASLIGISILQDRRFVFVNPQIPRIFKSDSAEILEQPLGKFIHAEDLPKLEEGIRACEEGGQSQQEMEVRIACRDEAPRTAMVHLNLTRYRQQPAVLLNLVDVTETKRMQEQLIHYQKLESIGTLAGGIAHDFNNILQGISGYTALMGMQLPPDSPLRADLAMIDEASNKAAILTKKLLGFARKGKYVVSTFNVHDVIEAVITFSRRTIPLNIDFLRHFNPAPMFVQGDRTQMEQVLLNLFLNSRDAMPGGGQIRVKTRRVDFGVDMPMENHVIKQGFYAHLMVEDTGCGIPPDVLPKIFDPFFTTKPVGQGSGLGLATVYGIIKNHHGYIYIESEMNRGTRIHIYLPETPPLQSAPDVDQPLPASAGEPLPEIAGKMVLVVDDEQTNRRFLMKLLQGSGCGVLLAVNGAQAVNIFQQRHGEIDLVILDINMPVMSGQAALGEILKIRLTTPVLLLSGYGEDQIVQEMLRMGGRDFVTKPVNAEVLLSRIRLMLQRA